MWPCVPRQAHRCGERSWAASNCLPLFKLTTGITHPIGLGSCLAGIAILLAHCSFHMDSWNPAWFLHSISLQKQIRKAGLAVLVARPHEGLFQVSAGPHFIIIPIFLSSICIPENTWIPWKSFLPYLFNRLCPYLYWYIYRTRQQIQSSFLTENKTHWVPSRSASLADLAWKFCIKSG